MGLLITGSVALFTLLYTYVGYPVLIYVAGRLFPTPVRRDDGYRPRVSALIAAQNGEAWVGAKLDSLLGQDYPADALEILVCSDGSTDGTDAILAEYAARDPRVRPFRSDERRGKPHALNLLRPHARGEVLLMTDIRQPLSPNAVGALVAHLADPEVGCASGELVLEGESGAGLYWRYERWIRENESRFRGTVGVTGALYVLRTADLPELPEDLILDDVWIPMALRRRGKRVLFVPGALAYDKALTDDRELPRKVRTLAGNYQLFAGMPALLVPFLNPSWFETLSHKVARLVCPWALVALLASTLTLVVRPPAGVDGTVSLVITGLLVGQLLFYGLAAVGARAGRIAGVARTFVVLNYAAVAGLWRFVAGAQKVAW